METIWFIKKRMQRDFQALGLHDRHTGRLVKAIDPCLGTLTGNEVKTVYEWLSEMDPDMTRKMLKWDIGMSADEQERRRKNILKDLGH